jgi:hypothetical protein
MGILWSDDLRLLLLSRSEGVSTVRLELSTAPPTPSNDADGLDSAS